MVSMSPIRHQDVLEDLPAVLFLWFFRLHTQCVAISANLVLQTGNNTNRDLFLLAAKTIRSADHLCAPHGLCMPMITVKAAFKMSITFSLQKVVVMALLGEIVHVVILAVVANLLHHSTHSGLVLP